MKKNMIPNQEILRKNNNTNDSDDKQKKLQIKRKLHLASYFADVVVIIFSYLAPPLSRRAVMRPTNKNQ